MEKVTLKGRITANRMDREGAAESTVTIQHELFKESLTLAGIYPLGAEVTVEVKVR